MTAVGSERAAAPAPRLVACVLLPFAGAYSLSYLYRSVNAIIAPDLVAQFGLTPAQLGLLTSAYFLSFAAFQLPLGLLLDRFGPRRTDAGLLLIAALGALLFATAPDWWVLLLGRALVGLGVSGCLMSGIKANVLWFSRHRLPAMNGWMFFSGGMGMMAATLPVELALRLTDWRGLFLACGLATLAAAVWIFRAVPERAPTGAPEPLSAQLRGLGSIFAARAFWTVALAAMATQATSMAVLGLWAGPWLHDVAALGRAGIASVLLLCAVATMLGFLLWGNLATWLERRGMRTLTLLKLGMGAFMLVQLLLALGVHAPATLLWMAYALFGTAGSLTYAVLSHGFPAHLAGRVNTALNSLVFSWAFVVQWAIGEVIGLWPAIDGRYHPDAYRAAFAAFLAVQAAGYAWLLFASRRKRAGRFG